LNHFSCVESRKKPNFAHLHCLVEQVAFHEQVVGRISNNPPTLTRCGPKYPLPCSILDSANMILKITLGKSIASPS
jgi:hypothetical protein